ARAVRAVAARHRSLGLEVRQQWKVELAIAGECGVAPHAVHRDPEELGVVALELRQDFVVEGHLIAAHGAPVRGIEGQDHGPAADTPERHRLTRGARDRKSTRLNSSHRTISYAVFC